MRVKTERCTVQGTIQQGAIQQGTIQDREAQCKAPYKTVRGTVGIMTEAQWASWQKHSGHHDKTQRGTVGTMTRHREAQWAP